MALRIAPEVQAELDEIWRYVAAESGDPDVAERLINSITDHFFLLSKHPHMGRTRDHDLRPGLRSLPVGAYVIIHRIEGRDVLIVHVFQGRRDLKALLKSIADRRLGPEAASRTKTINTQISTISNLRLPTSATPW
jgi:toxin ParE1/3/4